MFSQIPCQSLMNYTTSLQLRYIFSINPVPPDVPSGAFEY